MRPLLKKKSPKFFYCRVRKKYYHLIKGILNVLNAYFRLVSFQYENDRDILKQIYGASLCLNDQFIAGVKSFLELVLVGAMNLKLSNEAMFKNTILK